MRKYGTLGPSSKLAKDWQASSAYDPYRISESTRSPMPEGKRSRE